MPEIGAGEVSAAGPATCAAYAPVTSAAAAKVSQHRLIARSGGSGRELASNRDPPRFPFICLNRRLESSLGWVIDLRERLTEIVCATPRLMRVLHQYRLGRQGGRTG